MMKFSLLLPFSMARVDRVELNQYEFDLSDSIIIKCSCDGSPCPLNTPLQWYRDGKRLSDSSEIMNLNDRIHFMSYSKSMEGKYECRVGARSSPPAIVKTGFFEWIRIENTVDRSILAGEEILLQCNTKAFPTPVVKWYRDSEEMRPDANRILISANQMRIGISDVIDTGRYYCMSNGHQSNPVHITVRSNGFESAPGAITSERVGSRLVMECVAKAGSVYWVHNEVILKPGEAADRLVVNESGSLIIEKVRKSDSGSYSCMATDDHRTDTLLQIIDDYPEYKILRLSESLELTCKLDEVESIGWFHDNIKQDLNGVNRFTISTTKMEDSGEWWCSNKNDDRHRFQVKINSVDDAEMKPPKVKMTSSATIVLSWELADPSAKTLIQYKSDTMDIWTILKRSTSQNETIKTESLRGDDITFRIAPYKNNDKISSQFSSPSVVVNLGDGDNFTLLVGIIAGAVGFVLIITVLIIILLKRYRRDKPMKVVSKKEFIYNPQPYSLHYGQHLETAQRHPFPHRNGSDSGHGTTSSSRDENAQWTESPLSPDKTANVFHKDTLISGINVSASETSYHSNPNQTQPYQTHDQYSQLGEYAQIEILPARSYNTHQSNHFNPYLLNQSARQYPTEPIYESLDHC